MLLFTAPRDALLAPLQSVSGIVEKRHTLPILSNVLIEKKGDALTLLATDIEIQIRNSTSAAQGAEDVAITVGARKLQDILRALPDSADGQPHPGRQAQSPSRPARAASSSRPCPPPTTRACRRPRRGVQPRHQPKRRSRSSSAQGAVRHGPAGHPLLPQRPAACGRTAITRMVATDGHRLAYASSDLDGNFERTDVILPRKTVVELARQLADSDEPLEITLVGNQIVLPLWPHRTHLQADRRQVPRLRTRVIPQNHSKLVKASRLALLQALQRAAILTNEKFRGVRLMLSDGSLKLVSTNAEQEEAQEELEVDYSGDSLDIGFNVTYLLDVLTNLSANEIEIRFNDGNASALFGLPDETEFKYVVMPMRI